MAQDTPLPFLLSSHTQTIFPLTEGVLCDSADIYRNQVIHVVTGEGDRMKELQLLSESNDGEGHSNASEDHLSHSVKLKSMRYYTYTIACLSLFVSLSLV